ncbi:PadR family transcriptional regulator [Streptomyces palmae]|uniref:PadR family transcriptional regulator n=1 Tax=Streptomyces palmae TaxID=1701085 RepID=A0A4Z0HFE9_9ACTN|nr:PadR family transcriptional regulator [Streptomyces palmae]TGB18067.1 PadR family transcriptional regulator [Streptomyces palmae]
MSLRHAILTALLEKPSSGLELTRRFDKSIGYFWPATHQQIYRELGKLEETGLIRALPAAQPTRGQKKEYEVLPAGRVELAAWTAESQDPKPVRDPLLLRLRAAAVVGPQGLEAELDRHLELHRDQLAEYQDIERRHFPPERNAQEDRLRHLVLRAGIGLEVMRIEWLTQALGELRELSAEEAQDARDAADEGSTEPAEVDGSA